MKEINLKHVITQHIDNVDSNIDCTSDVMERINKRSKRSSFSLNVKRPLVVVLILLLVSTIAYAATSEIFKLKNSSGDEVGSVQIDETEKNSYIESHIENRDLFTYEIDTKLRNGTVIVIDTKNPSRFDISYYHNEYTDHNQLATTIDKELLPERLMNFEFSGANVFKGFILPTKEERAELVSENSHQRFYAHQLQEIDKIERIEYEYKKKHSDEKYFVSIDYTSKGNFMELSNMIESYQIVNLDTVEAFLKERKNNAISYSNNGETVEIEFENDYSLSWYEPEHGFAVNCFPHLNNAQSNRTFPEDTDESLLQLGTAINKELNEK